MPLKPRDVEKLLKNKLGFQPAKTRSDDHRYYVLQLDGLPPIHTKVSHTKAEIGPNLESKIARQMRVRGAFFALLLNCQRGRRDYERQVRDDPYPPFGILL